MLSGLKRTEDRFQMFSVNAGRWKAGSGRTLSVASSWFRSCFADGKSPQPPRPPQLDNETRAFEAGKAIGMLEQFAATHDDFEILRPHMEQISRANPALPLAEVYNRDGVIQ
jgi:hypothetical protein